MKVRDLKNYICDKIVLYKSGADDFIDIYKGYIDDDTPETVLDLEVRSIGAKRSGIVYIRVEWEGCDIMADYKITYIGDNNVSNVHHIGIDYNGNYYSVIFGKYINGGFFSILNCNCGGELAAFDDVFWNAESISKAIKSKRVGKVIALAISEFN